MSMAGTGLCCGICGDVIYPGPDPITIRNHNIDRLADGRAHWWSRDFEVTVHLCRSEATEAAVSSAVPLADRMLAALGLLSG